MIWIDNKIRIDYLNGNIKFTHGFTMKRLLVLLCVLSFSLFAQPGTYDTGFSTDGYDIFSYGASNSIYNNDVAVLSDGTILTAGYYQGGGNNEIFIRACNADGTVKNSFGTNGDLVITIPGATGSDAKSIQSIDVTSDGKIIVAGDYNSNLFIAKFNSDGTYDATFGAGGEGYVTYNFGGSERVNDVLVLPDNKLLLTGYVDVVGFILKLEQNGSPDASFIGGGVSILNSLVSPMPQNISLQSDGKILIAGFTAPAHTSFVARYSANGASDVTFSGDGIVLFNGSDFPFALGDWDYLMDVVQLSSGKLVAGGFYQRFGNYHGFLAGMNADGSVDATFGTGGINAYRVSNTNTVTNDIVYSSVEDKIYAGGYVNIGGESQLVSKFNSDGSLDTGFDTDGHAYFNLSVGLYDRIHKLYIQDDNKIIGIGSGDNSGYKGTIARLNNTQITLPSPSVVGPVNGITGQSILPTFTWNPVSGAASYKLIIATDAAFSNKIYEQNVGNDTTVSFTEFDSNFPLGNGTTYYWKVASVIGSGGEFYTSDMHFTTINNVAVFFGNPTGGIVYSNPTLFSWYLGQSANNLKFNIQVTRATSGGNADWSATPDFDVTTTNLSTSISLLYGQTYYWRVIVKNLSDEIISYSSTVEFETAGGAEIPLASWPVGGNLVYTNNPTLYWYQNSLQTGLDYDVRYRVVGSGSWTEITDIDNMYYTIVTALQPGNNYEWQIQSVYLRGTAEENTSGYSASSLFTTNGAGTVVTPVLSYPTGNVLVYTTSPTVYWYLNAAGTGLTYNVYYRTGGGAWTHAGTTANMYQQLNGLTPGSTYEWFATATNGTDSLSAGASAFTVAGGTGSSYPVASWPTGNPVMYTANPTLSWYLEGSSLGVTGYVVRLKEGANSSNWNTDFDSTYSVSGVNNTSITLTNALDFGTTYYWAVAANDGSLSDWGEGSFTIIGASVAGAPIVSYPTGGDQVYDTEATLSWYMNGSTTGIVEYEVVYSYSDVYAPGVTTTVTSAAQSVAVSNLVPGATYYWKVRSNYGGGNYSNFSNPQGTFVVMPGSAPAQPVAGGPDNVMINTSNPQLTWFVPTGPVSGSSYTLEIANNFEMAGSTVIENITNSNQVVSDLNSNSVYYWRVKTKNDDGSFSYYSNTGKFSTGGTLTSVEDDVLPAEFELSQNYPNPFNPSTAITYSLPEGTNVRLSVYNILGSEVAVLVDGFKPAGTHNVNFNASELSSGVYFYRIDAGQNSSVKKMILMK